MTGQVKVMARVDYFSQHARFVILRSVLSFFTPTCKKQHPKALFLLPALRPASIARRVPLRYQFVHALRCVFLILFLNICDGIA